MRSMTGYGRCSAEIDGRQMTVELKSVNHRYLDVSYRMPRSLSFLEEEARRVLSARVFRGHVDVYISYQNLRDDAQTVVVDQALLSAHLRALKEIADLSGAASNATAVELARLPDVVTVREAEEDRAAVIELMRHAITEGRKTRPELKVGICGEHGGDPSSIEWCHIIGNNYVSCSPFRVPVARLAAAQAAIDNPRK